MAGEKQRAVDSDCSSGYCFIVGNQSLCVRFVVIVFELLSFASRFERSREPMRRVGFVVPCPIRGLHSHPPHLITRQQALFTGRNVIAREFLGGRSIHNGFSLTLTKMAAAGSKEPDAVLYTIPASNYSARVKYIIEKKNLRDRIAIRRPEDGMKSPSHLAVSPLGKAPSLVLSTGESLFESTIIAEYIIARYKDSGPSFEAGTILDEARAKLIARVIDLYIGVEHGSMYKAVEGSRDEALGRLLKGFDVLEKCLPSEVQEGGFAMGGKGPTIADAALLGNLPFYDFHLKPIYGIHVGKNRPKVAKWIDFMRQESDEGRGVYEEVWGALQKWWDDGRYVKLGIMETVGQHS